MQAKDMKILVVDDSPLIRKYASGVLNELGYDNVVLSENGLDAYNKLQKYNFDLVISDWNMPELDGLGLLQKIRSDEKLKELPFLMMTATAEAAQVEKAIKEGIDGYIVKPVTANEIKKQMDVILQKLDQ